MPDYELIYILDPDLTEEQVTDAINRVVSVAQGGGAQVEDPERWPKRRLAYAIKDKREGFYVVTRMQASPPAITELDRVLKLTEPVLRHMVVRQEEEKKPPAPEVKAP